MKATSSPSKGCAAGIYTSPILLPLVAHLLASFGALDKLQNFVSTFGRNFYGLDQSTGNAGTRRREFAELRKLKSAIEVQDKFVMGKECVVPFWAGQKIGWELSRWGREDEVETP
jgi:dihydroorotase